MFIFAKNMSVFQKTRHEGSNNKIDSTLICEDKS